MTVTYAQNAPQRGRQTSRQSHDQPADSVAFGVIHLLDQEVIDKSSRCEPMSIGGSALNADADRQKIVMNSVTVFMECQSLLSFRARERCEVNAVFPS